MAAGLRSNSFFMAEIITSSGIFPVPNSSTFIAIGSATPIAYETVNSHLSAKPAATIVFATHLAAYEADRSTFEGSFPLKAPPP